MDKLSQYRAIIMQLLNNHAELANKFSQTELKMHVIFDQEHDRYMVFRTGWWQKERIRSANVYLRLENEKIWIEEDMTEHGIASDLLKAGVPREDIVLAFHPPKMRPFTEFAVA